jgi:hypothetical protein
MRTLKYFLAIVSLSAIALAPTTPVLAQEQNPESACRYACLEAAEADAQACATSVGPSLSACLDGVRATVDACLASCR